MDPGTVLHFFIIKTSIRGRVSGSAFQYQPLVIVVKHSIIKLDVTELQDLPVEKVNYYFAL